VLLNRPRLVLRYQIGIQTERRKDYETKDFEVQLLTASPPNTIGVMYSHHALSTRILIFQDDIECVDDTGAIEKGLEKPEYCSFERRTHNPIL
jgi:hypothetical protein